MVSWGFVKRNGVLFKDAEKSINFRPELNQIGVSHDRIGMSSEGRGMSLL